MSQTLLAGVAVFLGGGLGAISRHIIGLQVAKYWGIQFPYGTLFINILGSLLIGMIACYFTLYSSSTNQILRLFLIVGVLGGFTTFSSFSLEILILLQHGQFLPALSYVLLSVLVSLLMVWLGFELVKWITQ